VVISRQFAGSLVHRSGFFSSVVTWPTLYRDRKTPAAKDRLASCASSGTITEAIRSDTSRQSGCDDFSGNILICQATSSTVTSDKQSISL